MWSLQGVASKSQVPYSAYRSVSWSHTYFQLWGFSGWKWILRAQRSVWIVRLNTLMNKLNNVDTKCMKPLNLKPCILFASFTSVHCHQKRAYACGYKPAMTQGQIVGPYKNYRIGIFHDRPPSQLCTDHPPEYYYLNYHSSCSGTWSRLHRS